jgi:hypothetical protein
MKAKLFLVMLVGLFVMSAVVAAKGGASRRRRKKTPVLEKIEFIHWKKDFAKPPCNGNGICEPELGEKGNCADCKNGGNGEEPLSECHAFMGKYGKKYLEWRTLPVQYVINPQLPEGLSIDLVTSAIADGAAEWDWYTAGELFNNSYVLNPAVQYGVRDGKNAIVFDDYLTAGVIAVTSVWYSPATKAIVEFDIKFDTDWVWGDATDPQTPGVMDVQNIAVHELGHAVGLADVYEPDCSEVTMYGYSDYGETKKRDLEDADVIGVTTLYGE